MREAEVQKQLIKLLEGAGWLVVKIIQSNMNGWPDLQAHRNGQTVFIEVKADKGVLAPLQEYRHSKLRLQGFEVIVARKPNEIQHLL